MLIKRYSGIDHNFPYTQEAKDMSKHWPEGLAKTAQIRIGRQTDHLAALKKFYHEGLGLPVIYEFHDHDGYNGLMLGLPDKSYHLEFVQHKDGSPNISPNDENLLVFYIPDEAAIIALADKLAGMGYKRVTAANPYWEKHSAITIEDPDKYRVVLFPGEGL